LLILREYIEVILWFSIVRRIGALKEIIGWVTRGFEQSNKKIAL